jgi:hypothetical protein
MEKEKLEGLLIDYIDNNLNPVDRQMIERELMENQDAYKLYQELKEVMFQMDKSTRLEPRPALRSNFENILKEEIALSNSAKTIFFRPAFYRVAAAVALLVVGGGIGFFISKQNDQRLEEIAKKVEAQEQQMKITNAITSEMMAKLGNDQSASQRIQGINVALKFEKADDEIVNALVNTMNEDRNTNVRLAALEALSKFIEEPTVRKALISSLSRQKDPHVQIALIQILVKIKEKGVVEDLQKIVDDEGTIQAVKDEAYSGILRLS